MERPASRSASEPRLLLAPLAGFTDAPFRLMCLEGGADGVFTEMVSAAGLSRGNVPTMTLMETMPGEHDVSCQLFGSSESELAAAAAAARDYEGPDGLRFTSLNLNAGCPVPKVLRSGSGAKLVNDPAKVGRLVKAMVEGSGLPVTVKTRLGPRPGENRVFEIADAAAEAGACGIIVHARYVSQCHSGPVHLDVLADVVRRTALRVAGNGGVVDAASCRAMAATGVDAIMVGRGALARPDIFAELRGGRGRFGSGGSLFRRHMELLLAFREQLARRHPRARVLEADAMACLKARTHLCRYFAGRPGAAAIRAALNSARTLGMIYDIIHGDGN